MQHAIIDLGSNTVRLVVFWWKDNEFSEIINYQEVVGLAGYVNDGMLSEEGVNKACEVITLMLGIASKFVEKKEIYLFATDSLRNISNQDDAAREIFVRTGMQPDILTGEEEAHLEFIGATHRMEGEQGVLVDIGGSSTEIVLFKHSHPLTLKSMPIGCLNLYNKYTEDFLPDAKQRQLTQNEVQAHWDSMEMPSSDCPLMIGVGGTIRAARKLAELLLAPEKPGRLQAEDVTKLLEKLSNPDAQVFRAINKAIPERALTITPGLIILKQAIDYFGCETIRISKHGVREGYLLERVVKALDTENVIVKET